MAGSGRIGGRIGRRVGAVGGAAAVAVMATTLSAPPASAHETSLSLGANTASVSSDHTQVTVCDNEDDGNPVFARFDSNPLGGAPDLYFDRYDGSCSTYSLGGAFRPFSWALCEPYGGCSFTFL